MAVPVPEDKACVHLTKVWVAEEITNPRRGWMRTTFPEDVGEFTPTLSTEADVRACSYPRSKLHAKHFHKTSRKRKIFSILFNTFSFSPRNIQENFIFQL